ncbi:hypothetical protein C1H46_005577 [Malus baccata]|uniref:Uncharacterized protein n=1 Tax=Malus baccata TaxID=106549 RepID=A0A540NCQ5_MALBA|nr:hypothetical protein C1H46_005577 [Malus baccata]
MEKLNEKFQVLKVEKISLEEMVKKQQEEIYELNKTLSCINEVETEKEKKCGKPVHQAFVADSEAESEPVKIAYKIVIASDHDVDILSKQVLQTLEKIPTESQTHVQPQTRTMVRRLKQKARRKKKDIHFYYTTMEKTKESNEWK